ncbi:MAG: hypothetical protein U1F59_09005 [Candidatus Competibacteraceae bacterium]
MAKFRMAESRLSKSERFPVPCLTNPAIGETPFQDVGNLAGFLDSRLCPLSDLMVNHRTPPNRFLAILGDRFHCRHSRVSLAFRVFEQAGFMPTTVQAVFEIFGAAIRDWLVVLEDFWIGRCRSDDFPASARLKLAITG